MKENFPGRFSAKRSILLSKAILCPCEHANKTQYNIHEQEVQILSCQSVSLILRILNDYDRKLSRESSEIQWGEGGKMFKIFG